MAIGIHVCTYAYAHAPMHISYHLEAWALTLCVQDISEPGVQRGGNSPVQIQFAVHLALADAAAPGAGCCVVG